MCSVIGITGRKNAAALSVLGLGALQGRGHQASGVGACDEHGEITVVKKPGMVRNLQEELKQHPLTGKKVACGHTRYGTEGANLLRNAHPFLSRDGRICLIHNGEIVKAAQFRAELESQGVEFDSTSDSETILRMLEHSKGEGMVDRVLSVLNRLGRAFALVIIWDGYLIGACDCKGTHPLCFGSFDDEEGGFVFASEDSALWTIGATPIKEVRPGRVIMVSPDQEIQAFWLDGDKTKTDHCSFNFDYTACPDSSLWGGRNVAKVRQALGTVTFDEMLHSGKLPTIDLISPVLDSGQMATLAFAKAFSRQRILELVQSHGIAALESIDLDCLFPLDFSVIRAHDPIRNFQVDTQENRNELIVAKHRINPALANGRRILLGDDTIVRATTTRKIISRLRRHGATEVHMVVFAPPVIAPCRYGGTETKDASLLAARGRSVDEVRELIGADSLYYLSLNGYRGVINAFSRGHCMSCFTDEFED